MFFNFIACSYDNIGYSKQNFIGGIIGLIISGILFISATLFLASSNIKRFDMQPMNTSTPLNTRAHSFNNNNTPLNTQNHSVNNIQEPRVNMQPDYNRPEFL
jgi:hypothetical protein